MKKASPKPALKEGDTFEYDGDTFIVDGRGGASTKDGKRTVTEPSVELKATESFLKDSNLRMKDNLKHTTFKEGGKGTVQKMQKVLDELSLSVQEARRGIQPDKKAFRDALDDYTKAYESTPERIVGDYDYGDYKRLPIVLTEPDRFERIFTRTELYKAFK